MLTLMPARAAIFTAQDFPSALRSPDGRIIGTLTYSTPVRIEIPERVLPPDRVTFEPYVRREMLRATSKMWSDRDYHVILSFLSVAGGFVVTLKFFVVIGALFLTLAPKLVRHLRRSIDARLGMSLLTGVIGLSILFGLVPIAPIVVPATIAVWMLGYILGA